MTFQVIGPRTFHIIEKSPNHYTTNSLEYFGKKIQDLVIQWQKRANILSGKFKPRKIRNFKGLQSAYFSSTKTFELTFYALQLLQYKQAPFIAKISKPLSSLDKLFKSKWKRCQIKVSRFIRKLEIPDSRVFLGVDVQLLGTSLVGARMPLTMCLKSCLRLNIHSSALLRSTSCKWD